MSNVIRWNPAREINAMQTFMDRLFDETTRRQGTRLVENNEGAVGALPLDIVENEKTYTVTTSLPGVKADDIKVNLHDDMLTIEAEIPARTAEKTETANGHKVLMQERAWGKFSRRVRLPQTVNNEAVEASYENGVLTLSLPKAEHALPRAIPVKNASSN